MQIAYINKGKASKKSETDKLLESLHDRDIRLAYRRHKNRIDALGVSEVEFIREMKKG